MKLAIVVLAAAALRAANPAELMFDMKLSAAQRNDGCYELRGSKSPETMEAMKRALHDPVLRSCAAKHLVASGAVDVLRDALGAADMEIRALAARAIGGFQRPEDLEALAVAARDSELLVATNAVEGLANFTSTDVLPYLLEIAARGGIPGTFALNRAAEFNDGRVVATARRLIESQNLPDKLAAIRVIAERGGPPDLPLLQEIAAKETEVLTANQRGFGFAPAISLASAAQAAIKRIQQRADATSGTVSR